MIKLKDILETSHVNTLEPSMVKFVFWDDTIGLKDERKRKEIFRILERNLKAHQFGKLSYSVSDIMDGIKYYPQTDKIVGNFPKHVFIHPNKVNKISQKSLLNMDKCRFKDELMKVSKTLQVQNK
jgi:hypothetical protein